jgi:tetratricopeptide (TPR) repeat protein
MGFRIKGRPFRGWSWWMALFGSVVLWWSMPAQNALSVTSPNTKKQSLTPSRGSAQFEMSKTQAEAACQNGQVEECLRLYRMLTQSNPEWGEGWWSLGTFFYEQNRYEEAIQALKKLVVVEPWNGQGWGLLAICEFQMGQLAPALEHFTESRRLGLADNLELTRQVRYYQALLLIRGGEFEPALEILDGFAVENIKFNYVLDALGLGVLRISEPLTALSEEMRAMVREFGQAAFLEGKKKYAEAGQIYRQLETRYRGRPNVAYAMGSNLLLQNLPEQAGDFFKQELARDPSHVASLLRLTVIATDLGRLEEANRYVYEAFRLDPGNSVVSYLLGRIHLQSSDLSRAIQMLQRSIALNPNVANVHFTLAQAYLRARQPAAAEREQKEFRRLSQSGDQSKTVVAEQ